MSESSAGPISDTATETDERTGTRRLDIWRQSVNGGQYGDMARGTGYHATYLSDMDGDGMCAEVGVYVIECADGSYGVEEMATIGGAVMENDVWRPDDDAEIIYDWATALAFDDEESAQKECDRLGLVDYSFALYLRKPGDS